MVIIASIPMRVRSENNGHFFMINTAHFIRRTTPVDVDGIDAVKSAAWPKENSDQRLIAMVLESSDHVTFAVETLGNIVGFVDGFLTHGNETLRWEVDLLAVAPGRRGMRLGDALVLASCTAGYEQGADFCRALIQVSNIASQKTFARSGFQLEDQPHRLYVASDGDNQPGLTDSTGLIIPVTTMNYQGIWLELHYAYTDLLAAKSNLMSNDIQVAGTVISEMLTESCRAAESLGYVCIGTYQWWIHRKK